MTLHSKHKKSVKFVPCGLQVILLYGLPVNVVLIGPLLVLELLCCKTIRAVQALHVHSFVSYLHSNSKAGFVPFLASI